MAQSGLGRVHFFLSRCQNSARQNRWFSSSTKCFREPVPVFKPTSSPELDQILTKFREELFIPQHLSLRQKNLIYKGSKAEQLEQSTVTASLSKTSEETYRLRPLNYFTAPGKKEIKKVTSLMKTPEDWHNLLPFLTGLTSSKRPLKSEYLERIIRQAGSNGMESCILECAKQAKRTGVTLNEPGKAIVFFQAIRRKAQQADFKGEPLAKALHQAQQTAKLLDDPLHTSPSFKNDPKRLPAILGTLLELNAARAVNENGGKDEDGAVLGYAQRTIGNWELGNYELPNRWHPLLAKLYEFIPVWHGLKLAKGVDTVRADSVFLMSVESRKREMEGHIDQALARVKEINGEVLDNHFFISLYRK